MPRQTMWGGGVGLKGVTPRGVVKSTRASRVHCVLIRHERLRAAVSPSRRSLLTTRFRRGDSHSESSISTSPKYFWEKSTLVQEIMPPREAACEPCRRSKLACDHLRPVCTRCLGANRADACEYRISPFKRRRTDLGPSPRSDLPRYKRFVSLSIAM